MPKKNVVPWNVMIIGYLKGRHPGHGLKLFREMEKLDVPRIATTMVSVISSCAQLGCIELGNCVRSLIMNQGLQSNLRRKNALMHIHSKCRVVETARSLFDSISLRDQISWNVMICRYTHTNHHKAALALFRQLQLFDVEPNEVTFLNVLLAMAYLGALDLCKWIHIYVEKSICESNSCRDTTSVALSTNFIQRNFLREYDSEKKQGSMIEIRKINMVYVYDELVESIAQISNGDAAIERVIGLSATLNSVFHSDARSGF
ncbi:pentatricopeptide repeat-containing protein At1g08070, chloroplastic-like [Aristolochia californica]|uniref:pentatricopeptide repeat-containing protein At1g08070, chloroplastic-like n=1 Tax=Aristolochia californica TaxID=171875 RepID=UPI0035DC856B